MLYASNHSMVRVLHWEFAEGFSSPEAKCTHYSWRRHARNNDELFTRFDWLPLHLEVKVNICVQVHKRINGRSPGSMSDLLVLNSHILNERNYRNNSLNLVCPRFKREIEAGADVHLVWGQQDCGMHAVPNSLKKIECVRSFKKALIDFYASS